jgi:long-chain acyl-CoA synthetase
LTTLGDISRVGARSYPDAEAVVFENSRFTYREFDRRINRLANVLANLGTAKGDRVAILAENTHKYLEVYLGAAKAGLVTTPLNFRLSHDELGHILRDSEAKVVLVGEGYEATAQALLDIVDSVRTWIGLDTDFGGHSYEQLLARSSDTDPLVTLDENELAVLMYTGGTTGTPKGVMLSHRNILASLRSLCEQNQITALDTTCMVLPLFHVSFWPAFCCLKMGGKVVVIRRPDILRTLTSIQQERCTHINAVPTLYAWLITFPDLDRFDLSSVRLMSYAGSPMPESILQKCISKFGNRLAQGYGLTETSPAVSELMPEDHVLAGPRAKLLKSVGRSLPGIEVRVVDGSGAPLKPGETGEIAVRGENVLMGYWKNPRLTAEKLRDGWLHTADIGYMDEEGYIYLVDRKSDMIITGGENVYPKETENVLYSHPAVQECAVTSAPDENWGERVQAAVVLKPGVAATEKELIEFCKSKLAGYKCPKKIEFWQQLPKTPVGKIMRKDVKAKFWGEAASKHSSRAASSTD